MIRPLAGIVLGMCLLSAPAFATSPESEYLAARDKDVAAIRKLEAAKAKPEKIDAAQKTYLADLARRLTALVGPVSVEGFPKVGKFSYETLSADSLGFGMLDAMSFANDDNSPRLVVTTRGLLGAWLHARAAEKDASLKMPEDEKAAFALDEFFTAAIAEDAAFAKTADIPITAPAGADLAVARLGGWSQEMAPNPNSTIEVVVIKGGRVSIVDAPAKAPVPKIAACEAVWTAAETAHNKFLKAYDEAKNKDEKAFDAASAEQTKGYNDYRACLVLRLPKTPEFAAIVAEAQAYADKVGR